jgi:hypothetical protein
VLVQALARRCCYALLRPARLQRALGERLRRGGGSHTAVVGRSTGSNGATAQGDVVSAELCWQNANRASVIRHPRFLKSGPWLGTRSQRSLALTAA